MSIIKRSTLFSETKNLVSDNGIVIILFTLMLYTITMPIHIYVKCAVCVLAMALVRKTFNKTTVLILAFSLTYTIFGLLNESSKSNFESFCYLIGPLIFYSIGQQVVRNSKSAEDISTLYLYITIFASIVLWRNNIVDGLQNGLVNVSRILDIAGTVLGATGQGLIASIGLASVSYVVAKGNLSNIKTVLFFICSLLSLYCVIHLVNRSGLLVFAFTILATMMYTSRENLKKVILIALILIGLYYLFVNIGLINEEVFEVYEKRNMSDNGSASTAGGRVELWTSSLEYLFQYPMGWSQHIVSYSHNLWLDIARCTGWIPFLLFIALTINSLKTLYKLYKVRGDWFIGFLIGLNGCFLLSSSVEPVIESSSTYFYLIFMIWGIQKQYYYKVAQNSSYK